MCYVNSFIIALSWVVLLTDTLDPQWWPGGGFELLRSMTMPSAFPLNLATFNPFTWLLGLGWTILDLASQQDVAEFGHWFLQRTRPVFIDCSWVARYLRDVGLDELRNGAEKGSSHSPIQIPIHTDPCDSCQTRAPITLQSLVDLWHDALGAADGMAENILAKQSVKQFFEKVMRTSSYCVGTNCKNVQSEKLLRDLEELCSLSAGCQAVHSGCLDLCGRGPNVKVLTAGDQNVVEGVKTFKAARSLLEKNGVKLRKLDFQVAEVKYEARRQKTSEDRLSKVQQCFKAIGGETVQVSTKEPQLASSLFAFRAEERVTQDPTKALEDAKKATELTPDLAGPRWTAALAMLKLGQVEQAREECARAQDGSGSYNKEHMRLVTRQLAEIPQPKAEPPKAEPPKAEPPKAEPAKAEPPKVEPPKVELPKAALPRVVSDTKTKQENQGAPENAVKAEPAEAKAMAKAPGKAPAKAAAKIAKIAKNHSKTGEEGTDEKKPTTNGEKSEVGDKGENGDKACDKASKVSKAPTDKKLSRSASGLERAERTKKLLKSASEPVKGRGSTSKLGGKLGENGDPKPEDAQTTAAEVLSASSASVVAAELSETGLVDMGTSAVEPGWRDHFGHPHEGSQFFARPRTTGAEQITDSKEVDAFEWNFSDPRTPHCGQVDVLSTYNSFCSDRGSLIATPPPPKRNKRNRSQVPLGSLEEASIIKAPPISLPFDTRGFPSGRGGLSDEALSVELRFFGGRSHWHVGEREWCSSKSDVAFQQGVHKWPRPLGAGQNLPLRRCGTAPARSIESVFGRGPVASVLLRQGKPVSTLAELEAALCLAEKKSLLAPEEIWQRWHSLSASAVAWSFDTLATADPAARRAGEPPETWHSQALQMLCVGEILTRPEVAETYNCHDTPLRPFLRALCHGGLGHYYQLRNKPRAAVRFLEQGANGQAKWAHPAILLNLSAVHLQLKEPGKALSYLCQVVLALRSGTGPLCQASMAEVETALRAAGTAVSSVLGPPKEIAHQAVPPLSVPSHGIELGEEKGKSLRVVPGSALETPEGTKSSVALIQQTEKVTSPSPRFRPGLGRHGLVSKERTPYGQDAFEYELDAAVVRTLLVAKVLLWPWPEFAEPAATVTPKAESEMEGQQNGLEETLKEMASPSVAKHAAKLKKVWPQWRKMAPAPAVGLVFRECLLLSFLHAACALAQLSSKPVYSLWVMPPLREGLVLAIVLFGTKHPLALKLINACRRLHRPPEPEPAVERPPLSRRCHFDEAKPKAAAPKSKVTFPRPKVAPRRQDPRKRPSVPPAWNAGPGVKPPGGRLPGRRHDLKELRELRERGRAVAEADVPDNASVRSFASDPGHQYPERRIDPVRQTYWKSPERQRQLQSLHRQAVAELRRERHDGVVASSRISLEQRRPARPASCKGRVQGRQTPLSTPRGNVLRETLWQKAARHRHHRHRHLSAVPTQRRCGGSFGSLSASFCFPDSVHSVHSGRSGRSGQSADEL
eukprot:s1325_g17.t1